MEYILDRFQENVRTAPDAPFMYDDMHRNGMTFAEFDNLSARVYSWLKARGIGRERMVMIRLPRGVMPLVAAVGVWKAGAAFIIVEENYAPERVAYIRRDCGCVVELNRENIDDVFSAPPLEGYEKTDPHDAAFAVYTSGTTGNPKGVLHEYGNIDRCLQSMRMEGNPMLGSGIFRPYTAPQNFVAAVIGLVAMLAADHARMYIVPYATAKDPDALIRLFGEYRFNMIFLSPSYARLLVPKLASFLRVLVLSSEPAGNLYFADLDMRNFYASSESFFLIATFRIDRAYDVTPVGKPAFPLDLRIVDENGQDVPDGGVGEVIFDASYLRGYIHCSEENMKAIRDGFFHTGDLARRDEAGNLVILGRADDMVKINGNRVEPAEIENAVRRILGIDWAAAKVFTDGNGKSSVCVYYTADIEPDTGSLRKQLADYLPYYMIPSHFIHIDTIPLRPNGKLDRRALPVPRPEECHRSYVAPRNETEAALCRGFENVLGIPGIGVKDDFYELGGDSLRSIQLVMECGLPGLNAGSIFGGRTPEGIASLYLASRMDFSGDGPEEQNKAAMARPHALTAEQLYMVDVQLYTPKSTMYNLFTMLTAGRDELDAVRLAKAVGTAIKAHPSLLTTLFFNEDGEVMQRWSPGLFEEVRAEHVSEAELSRLQDTLVQPYRIIGERLYRCRLFVTGERVCLFLDVHHIVFDGASYRTLLNDIATVYLGGTPKPDYYYAMLENRERLLNGDFYQECRRYFHTLYRGTVWSTFPTIDQHSRENRLGELSVPLQIDPDRLTATERAFHISRNEFFIGVALLAIAAYNQASDVMVSWIYNGRDDANLVTTTGLLYRDLPLAIRLEQVKGLDEFFSAVHEQVCGGIQHSFYPYTEEYFSPDYGITACVLYQRSLYDPVRFGDVVLKPVEVQHNAKASQTILDIMIRENEHGIQLDLSYIIPVYKEESMVRFSRLLLKTISEICTAAGTDVRASVADLVARLTS